jgi:hypothetical protein
MVHNIFQDWSLGRIPEQQPGNQIFNLARYQQIIREVVITIGDVFVGQFDISAFKGRLAH